MTIEPVIKRDGAIALKLLFITVTCLAGVVFLAALLLPVVPFDGVPANVARAKTDATQLVAAFSVYRTEYGSFPEGDYPAIIRTLVGGNPRKIVYLEFRDRDQGPQGEWLDPWRTPYRVDLSDPAKPRASSAGKNKKFEPDSPDSDDVCSWR